MSDLGALDIDHVEIVKGPQAVELYGERARNGVVEITTKDGAAESDPPDISVAARMLTDGAREIAAREDFIVSEVVPPPTREQTADGQQTIIVSGYIGDDGTSHRVVSTDDPIIVVDGRDPIRRRDARRCQPRQARHRERRDPQGRAGNRGVRRAGWGRRDHHHHERRPLNRRRARPGQPPVDRRFQGDRRRHNQRRKPMTRSDPSRSLAVAAFCLLAACGGGGEGGMPGGGSASMDSPDFTIAPAHEALWTVGALDGEDWEVFGSVTDLAFNESGDLFVLDRQAAHVVVFDRMGAYLRTISRQGEGPGELTEPGSIAILADGRLAVFDRSRRGIQFFTQEGEYLESAPFDPPRGMPNFVRAWLPGGSILTDIETRMTGSPDGRMTISSGPVGGESERPIIRYGPDGSREVRYTAWDPPPPTGEGASTEGGSFQFTMSPVRAFDPSLSFVPAHGRAVGCRRLGRIPNQTRGHHRNRRGRPGASSGPDQGHQRDPRCGAGASAGTARAAIVGQLGARRQCLPSPAISRRR